MTKTRSATPNSRCRSNEGAVRWSRRRQKCIAYLDAFYRLLRRLLETSYPVICAINGHAFGAGLLLALCADYRVMRRDRGWLCLNEVEMNDPKFQPGIYGSADRKLVALVRRKVPASLIQPMILEAKRVTASDALSAGLVDVIGATEELLPLAREHARKWERLASSTYGVMKKELYRETIDVLRARL
eukprot:GEMP01068134.1.p1 GENE.GEMP01068134.1~~GEMP01068134.1.p1  ORF type:complete len:187 (+),score=39.97 GEMP01068134.1:191-751(+)